MRKLLILSLLWFPLFLQAATPKLPSDKELKALALDSLLAFNVAIQTKSFESFHGQIAKLWQKEVTPEKLLEIFQSFIDKEIDIAPIAKLEPAFEGTPAINEDGLLMIKGAYPMKPSKVLFELKYIQENERWKLVGINVHVKPTGDQADAKGKEKKKKDDSDDDDDDDDNE
jgi:hypothetical protein